MQWRECVCWKRESSTVIGNIKQRWKRRWRKRRWRRHVFRMGSGHAFCHTPAKNSGVDKETSRHPSSNDGRRNRAGIGAFLLLLLLLLPLLPLSAATSSSHHVFPQWCQFQFIFGNVLFIVPNWLQRFFDIIDANERWVSYWTWNPQLMTDGIWIYNWGFSLQT